MKKLLAGYKSLPPELRIFVAMIGLGTPAGAVYILQRLLKAMLGRPVPMWEAILYVMGFVLVVCILGFIFSKIFGYAKSKRKNKMAGNLAGDGATGPVSMETKAAIKANNEKFFKAIKDMKKNLNTDVFDLPWYIVIGDAGCGKTRLIEKGGLTFSAGRPEGYQLGTLNYNWWFTEDAVFVDMAGRLCNPQDDADYREWESFLDTISKGRRGYPINGAVVCVSAQHLLEDPPEKIEADANTALERLRDLQTKLGVTFATYMVITKCDKVLGFMQFFDRAERDIRKKQEMFGWSKPGEFGDLYNPDEFGQDFDDLYARLHDLRIHRLFDDAEQDELGMAYSFPEEFREFKTPLDIYVRTLFPMIKNPRGIKNLVFRGIFFTSATQEGSLVLKHLASRMGEEAAQQFQPLDLYPQKKPLFIKDLLFEKVFPEFGLVFRNEDQVHRNRRLAKVLRYGSISLGLVLFTLMGLSYVKYQDLIIRPRDDARKARPGKSIEPMQMAGVLSEDLKTLQDGRTWARILSMGTGSAPEMHLSHVHASLIEDRLMRPALKEVNDALGKRPLESLEDWEKYRAALAEYTAWYACRELDSMPQSIKADSFHTTLYGVVSSPLIGKDFEKFKNYITAYFNYLSEYGSEEGWRANPVALINGEPREGDEGGRLFDPAKVIDQAIAHAHNFMGRRFAAFGAESSDKDVQAWMSVYSACKKIEDEYGKLLQMAGEITSTDTLEGLDDLKKRFLESHQRFEAALADATRWTAGPNANLVVKIPYLRDKLLAQRQIWLDYVKQLTESAARCGEAEDDLVRRILVLKDGNDNLPGLDRKLWDNLEEAGLAKQPQYGAIIYENAEDMLTKEVDQLFPYIIQLNRSEKNTEKDELVLTKPIKDVQAMFGRIKTQLEGIDFAVPDQVVIESPNDWLEELGARLDAPDPSAQDATLAAFGGDWSDGAKAQLKPDEMRTLCGSFADLIRRGDNTQLLKTIEVGVTQTGGWGVAELTAGWDQPVQSHFSMTFVTAKPSEPVRRSSRPPARGGGGSRQPPERRGSGRTTALQPMSPIAGSGDVTKGQIPRCATAESLQGTAEDCAKLLWYLNEFTPDHFLKDADDPRDLTQVCRDSINQQGQRYMQAYVSAWDQAYRAKRLGALAQLNEAAADWAGLQIACKERRSSVTSEYRDALSELLRQVRFATFDPAKGQLADAGDIYAIVAGWYGIALGNAWQTETLDFAKSCEPPADAINSNLAPWDRIAVEMSNRWDALTKAVETCGEIPRKFDANTVEMQTIPWDQLRKRQGDCRLVTERLTSELVQFEKRVQELLSVELTESYVQVQNNWFRDTAPASEGWPYRDLESLATVEFQRFSNFLIETNQAQRVLASLSSLPESTPGVAERAEYLRRCEQWRTLFDFDARNKPSPLKFTLYPDYPDLSVGQGGVQKYYATILLAAGIEEKRDGASDTTSGIRISSNVEPGGLQNRRDVTWDWQRNALAGNDMTIRLNDPKEITAQSTRRFQELVEPLGTSSELGLCAYLLRYGSPTDPLDRKTWTVHHIWNLEQKFASDQQLLSALEQNLTRVGLKIVYQFDREIPMGVPKLERIRARR